jgi:hypothetical protein
LLIHKEADPEINEYSLLIMIDHDILRLDVSMYNFDNFMAVIQSPKHVTHVVPDIVGLQSHDFLTLKFLIEGVQLVSQGPFRVILGYQINVVLAWVVDYLVQVDDIRVLQALEHLQLLEDVHVGILPFPNNLAFKLLFVHLFHGKEFTGGVLDKFDSGIGPFAESSLHLVLVDHFGSILLESPDVNGAHHYGLTTLWPLV